MREKSVPGTPSPEKETLKDLYRRLRGIPELAQWVSS